MIAPGDLKPMMNNTLDDTFKGGVMITLSELLYRNKVNYKEFLYKICKVGCISLKNNWV